MGRRLGRAYSRTLREGMAGGRNRPREPSGPSLRRALRRPFGAPGSADAIAGAARQRPLGTVARRSLPDLRLPGHRKPLTRARRAATRPPPQTQAEIAITPAKSDCASAPSHSHDSSDNDAPSLISNSLRRRKPVPTAKSSREVPHGPPLSHHRAYGSRTTAVSLRVQRRMADREIDQFLLFEPSDVHGNLRLRRVGQAPPPSA